MGEVVNDFLGLSKSARVVALSIFILLSLGSVHYVTYVYAFPSHLRVLLDATFKVDFAANFALVATFSALVARYLPQTVLAVGTFLISVLIDISYYRRGYRRVASPLGIFEWSRVNDKEEREHFERRLRKFGRNDARMDNFVKRIVQSRLPVIWYEQNKYYVMAPMGILVATLIYVGIGFSLLLFSFFVFISAAYQRYTDYNDSFRFSLKDHVFKGDDPDHVPGPASYSAEMLLVTSVTLAVIFAIAGPLRLYSQIDGPRATLVTDSLRIEASIIGSNAHGILVFDEGFGFVPFSAIDRID
jgi:hypothetical protein